MPSAFCYIVRMRKKRQRIIRRVTRSVSSLTSGLFRRCCTRWCTCHWTRAHPATCLPCGSSRKGSSTQVQLGARKRSRARQSLQCKWGPCRPAPDNGERKYPQSTSTQQVAIVSSKSKTDSCVSLSRSSFRIFLFLLSCFPSHTCCPV